MQKQEKNSISKSRALLYKATISAMFLACAVAIKMLSTFYIPMFGTNGIKVSFGGIFTSFPALLFGPVFGGAASAASDIIGCIINPVGPWNPLITAAVFAGGFIKGLLFSILKKRDGRRLTAVFAVILAALALLSLTNYYGLKSDEAFFGFFAEKESVLFTRETLEAVPDRSLGTNICLALSSSASEKGFAKKFATVCNLVTHGLFAFSVLGLIILGVSAVISRKKKSFFFKIFVSVLVAELVTTTLNTAILILSGTVSSAFIIFWIPRVLEGIVVCSVQTYFIAILYSVYESRVKNRIKFLKDNT